MTVALELNLHQMQMAVDGRAAVPKSQEEQMGWKNAKESRDCQLRVHRLRWMPLEATAGLGHLIEDSKLALPVCWRYIIRREKLEGNSFVNIRLSSRTTSHYRSIIVFELERTRKEATVGQDM